MKKFLSKSKKIFLSAICAAEIFFGSQVVDAENFRDAEYFGSDGLDLINAAAAYEKFFTGKGIFIGVLDQPVNFLHPKFTAKSFSAIIRDSQMHDGATGVYDWQAVFHGTHVAGIAAGSRDGKVMHGTAFDAEILNAPFNTDYTVEENQRETEIDDPFTPYLTHGEIKIINNSWGNELYLDEILPDDEIKNLLEDSGEDWNKVTENLETSILQLHGELKPILESIAQAVDAKRLTIFAAGNGGHSGSCLQSQASWFNDNAEFYLLNVSNLYNKFDGNKGGLVRNADGKISGDWLLNFSSDGVKYLEDSSVAAPGSEILSANSNFAADGQAYVRYSGTSMATPFVTGTAALVQQAFPYMDGKQIADVILSTANNEINLTNNFRVALRQDIDLSGETDTKTIFLSVYYFDDKDRTEDEVVADLNRYAKSYRFAADKKSDADLRKEFKDIVKIAVENKALKVYFQTPLQSLIGQGVVDAGKAVNGLAALNARRLNANDVSTDFGEKIALYTVDTKGFDSTWSNDITEIREGKLAPEGTEPDLIERYNYYHVNWLSKDLTDYNEAYWSDILTERYVKGFNDDVDKDGLEGLHVGLKKIGDGRLNLSGNNSYQGASVVERGILSIDGKISGDAYSLSDGTISGRGTIDGTLFNRATAEAGDSSGSGDLTVGNLISSGNLVVNVSNAGNTKFIVRGAANLDGTTFVAKGEKFSGKEIVVLTAENISGNVKTADSSYRVEIRGNSVVLIFN